MPKSPRGETLTAKERLWVQIVAAGGQSDISAYHEAYGCSRATAEANAYKMRHRPPVMRALEAEYLKGDERRQISKQARLGRLGRVILRGNDKDAIRAVDIYSKLVGDYKLIGDSDSNQGQKSVMDLLTGAQYDGGDEGRTAK